MKRYRKRPVVIEAMRFTDEESAVKIVAETGAVTAVGQDPDTGAVTTLYIRTEEGVMEARRGDWVIRGIEGEVYPCKNSIFVGTYMSVED